MKKIAFAFISLLLWANEYSYSQHAKKYAELTDEEYASEYAEMKKSNDFSTDANGKITKFRHTLPNLCTIVWEGNKLGSFILDVKITSYDGDIYQGGLEVVGDVDYTFKKIYSNFKDTPKWSHEGPITRDVPLEDMWFIGCSTPGLITFADKARFPIRRSRRSRIVSIPLNHPGDYCDVVQELEVKDGKLIWTQSNAEQTSFRVTLEDGVFTYVSSDWADRIIVYLNSATL